jgi:hypothetical protein
MPRRVFFSFDYQHVYKVGLITKNLSGIIPTAAAGFVDSSDWDEKKVLGDLEVKQMIDRALEDTTVTVVFITEGAVNRKYINYEIYQSLAHGNGLVAVQIHHLPNKDGSIDAPGDIPSQIADNGFRAYKYSTPDALAGWIEEAALIAGK